MAILQERADLGRADPRIVAEVSADLENCHRVALCMD